MVTGASTAEVAVILIDARLGIVEQSRRHAYLASLLGIPHLAVAVNKMDLVGYDERVFQGIESAFQTFADRLRFQSIRFFPVSALKGDNVVSLSEATPWYDGAALLHYLESVPTARAQQVDALRYPVQTVIRPNLDYRGFAGQIAAGQVRPGDAVLVLPSAVQTRVKAIDGPQGTHSEAAAPLSVTLRLEDEVDISRGDMIVAADALPRVERHLEAHLVWFSEEPLDRQRTYLIKHTTQSVRVQVEEICGKIDLSEFCERPAEGLALNEIARVRLTAHRALYFDDYRHCRSTGAFILIDSFTHNTVAAGMLIDERQGQDLDAALQEIRAGSGLQPKTQVSPRERRRRLGQSGATVWLTGLPGSGRWALAYALERRLFDLGHTAHVIDPSGESLATMAAAAKTCTDAGLVTICAFPAYSEADRAQVRRVVGDARFVEVFVNTAEALCRERRPQADFSGFEAPQAPGMTLALDQMRVEQGVQMVLQVLQRRGVFDELDVLQMPDTTRQER
ncbi:MAG: elongation factor 1-alpha C-terminal domain-related protein, partial [Polyangiales bacterium]